MSHINDIARWIKGRSSHHLRAEFPELKKMPCMWSPSYFVASTGQVSTEIIKQYIENQRSKLDFIHLGIVVQGIGQASLTKHGGFLPFGLVTWTWKRNNSIG